jgi:putative NIF3 family GTP cyclohydrolase 1 type 2
LSSTFHFDRRATRRELLRIAAGTLASASGVLAQGPAATALTARQVVERIQKEVAVPWRSPTVDTFKAGNPDGPIQGIATTFIATMDVLQRAKKSGKNFVIAHEPTFYVHEDTPTFSSTSMYAAKKSFIEENGMVVFRFHDHLHARKPDVIFQGLAEALGWEKHATENPRIFNVPPVSLEAVTRHVRDRLKIRAMKTVGDPKLQVTKVALMPGAANMQGIARAVDGGEVNLIIIGETSEWQGMEYVRDAVISGRKIAIIHAGHVATEEPGMRVCAEWLKTFVPEVPIEFIPAREPFL